MDNGKRFAHQRMHLPIAMVLQQQLQNAVTDQAAGACNQRIPGFFPGHRPHAIRKGRGPRPPAPASEHVAHARPDGYTLLFGTAATHGINAALYKKMTFDVEADFTPLAPLVDVSNVLTINPEIIDVKSVQEFIDKVKAQPGKFNYASTGNGTGTHLAFAEFNARAGLEMVHVPYKGGPEALQAVLKGEVCCIFNQVQTVLSQYRAGKVRLLGVTTVKRVNAVAEVPTISEAGLPGFERYTWFGLFGPKGLDPQIVERISLAVKQALDTPAIRQRLIESGNTPHFETPEQFRATVKANRAKWAEVVRASGATID